jgi:hypothetical protein
MKHISRIADDQKCSPVFNRRKGNVEDEGGLISP